MGKIKTLYSRGKGSKLSEQPFRIGPPDAGSDTQLHR